MPASLVEELEEVIEEVADWAIKTILDAVDKFTLNSGPFGHVKLSPAEQLEEYATIKGNPQAWYSRIESSAQALIGELKSAGVPESEILKLHPYNVAFMVQAKYHLDMEKLLEKSNGNE